MDEADWGVTKEVVGELEEDEEVPNDEEDPPNEELEGNEDEGEAWP